MQQKHSQAARRADQRPARAFRDKPNKRKARRLSRNVHKTEKVFYSYYTKPCNKLNVLAITYTIIYCIEKKLKTSLSILVAIITNQNLVQLSLPTP